MDEEKKWYSQGDEGVATAKRLQEEREKGFGPGRLWLTAGTSGKFTFLDSSGFYFNEHSLKDSRGHYSIHRTCRRDFDECPLCDAGHRPSYVAAFTVVDHRLIERKESPNEQHVKRLLVVKTKPINRLAVLRKRHGDLTMCLIEMQRTSKKECNTGESLDFLGGPIKRENYVKYLPEKTTMDAFLEPFDYVIMFAPLSVEALRKEANIGPPAGSEQSSSASVDDGRSAGGELLPEGSDVGDDLEALL